MSLFGKQDPDQHKITPNEAGMYLNSLRTGSDGLSKKQVEAVKSHMDGYMDVDDPHNKKTTGIHGEEAAHMVDAIKHDPYIHLSESQQRKLESQTETYVKDDKKKPFSLF